MFRTFAYSPKFASSLYEPDSISGLVYQTLVRLGMKKALSRPGPLVRISQTLG